MRIDQLLSHESGSTSTPNTSLQTSTDFQSFTPPGGLTPRPPPGVSSQPNRISVDSLLSGPPTSISVSSPLPPAPTALLTPSLTSDRGQMHTTPGPIRRTARAAYVPIVASGVGSSRTAPGLRTEKPLSHFNAQNLADVENLTKTLPDNSYQNQLVTSLAGFSRYVGKEVRLVDFWRSASPNSTNEALFKGFIADSAQVRTHRNNIRVALNRLVQANP